MQFLKRLITRILIVAAIVVPTGAVLVYVALTKSLPQIDGDIVTDGISADVTIARDESGIPVITASSRRDLAYATGYVHGQDRFFQMDLTRRNAAGELAELFGEVALPLDRRNRFHRFRARAEAVLDQVSAAERNILEAYAAGVNDGLSGLGAKPFEYFLVGTDPRPWEPADSLLTVYAMFMELNDERAHRDVRRGLAHRVLPQAVFDWLYPDGTGWDAPLAGEPRESSPRPGPEVYNLNGSVAPTARVAAHEEAEPYIPGSNNWAVAGSLTASGGAIVANDMHLGITTPNVFYRARMRVTGSERRDLNGVTLPGAPVLVAGSNGNIAWGNTNSYGDWSDAVIVVPGDADDIYLTQDGPRQFVDHRETILVKGGEAEEFLVRETIWGPVLDDETDPDRMLAVSWIAHHAEAVTLGHLELETAKSASAAMDIANRIGMPPQNFVVGDAAGNIGWTIAGKIPRRSGYDPLLPADWSRGDGWHGWLAPSEYPRIYNPESGRIWTANARVVDGEALEKIGDGGYDLAARARQIRDGLFSIDRFAPEDMLAVQLDDRAVFLERWRDQLLGVLDDAAIGENADRRAYRELVENWIPRAATESVGYRLVRAFRSEVRQRVLTMLMQPVLEQFGEDTELRISNQFEGPLWSLINERPAHLLTDNYASWRGLMLQAIDTNIEFYAESYDDGLEQRRWGERNTAAIRHPMSRALPFLSSWLDMPAEPLHGDSNLPRAQSPTFGASERFAVAPGNEAAGYLHMPAGQSGHPLSEYYRLGHDDWVHGRPTAFLPGEARHTLTLRVAR